MKKTFSILFALAFLLSCRNNPPSLKPYYFPYSDFLTPRVYKYVNAKDTTQFQYWRFETGAKDGDTVMTTGIYDDNLRLLTVYHNKLTNEGSRLQLMFINLGDSTTLYQCEVKQNESFNWKVKSKTPLYISFGMKSPDGTESREIVSERSFEPKKEMLTFNGDNYECVVVKESTMFNFIKSNRTRSEEQQRTSYFAKGVGLVQYETFFANGKSELFKLDEIIIDQDRKMFAPQTTDSISSIQ